MNTNKTNGKDLGIEVFKTTRIIIYCLTWNNNISDKRTLFRRDILHYFTTQSETRFKTDKR